MAKSSIDVFLRLHGQRKFSKEVATSGAELEAMGLKGARSMAAFAASSEKLKGFGRSWTRHVTLPAALGVGLAAKAAIDWETAFTGVRKTVNATQGQFAQMEHGLRSMALHIPVAATDLAGIAEAAGQLGIKRTAILGFTRVIADLGVATNLAGDEGATTLARFANITQMPQSQFDRLGSTIVALGNAGASTEKDIAMMGLRIAAAGNYVGMSEPQILGYANALSSVGIEAEAGGSAISLVFKLINSAVSEGGKNLAAFAGVSGESSSAFAKHWKKDAASASVAWIEGLSRLKKEGKDVPAVLNALSPKLRGIRVQDTLLRASGAGDLLRESLGLGAKAWKENNALSEEASKRYKTVASRLQILKNKVIDAGISLGQELLPPLIDFVEFAGPKVGAVAEAFGALPGPVKAAALGFLLLTGPVASGLGYFAGGIGRALILTTKLAKATKSLSIFTSAMQAGQGFSASSSMAMEGSGVAAAGRYAKGFAFSLGPAVAGYGIGNIITSATSGDWKDAGFEAGGALAGGIAGFMIGGPMGAMLGVGIGSLGGELLAGLFDSKDKSIEEEVADRIRGVGKAMDAQRSASKALSGATGAVLKAHHRQRAAAQEVKTAEHALASARQGYPSASQAVIKAEVHLAKATERVTNAKKAAKRAERLKGEMRSIAKEQFRSTTLELRGLQSRVMDQQFWLRRERHDLIQSGASRKELRPVNEALIRSHERLADTNKKLTRTFADAGKQIGPKFAGFLRKAGDELLNLGSRAKQAAKWQRELNQQTREYAQAQAEGRPMIGSPSPKGGVTTPETAGGGGPPVHRPKAPTPRHSGAVPRPRVRSWNGGRDQPMGWAHSGDVVHQTVLSLDGKVLAESVTRHATKAANRG